MRILVKTIITYNKETKALENVSSGSMLIDINPCDDERCQIISEVRLTAGSILFEKKEETAGERVQRYEYFNQLTNPIVKPDPPRWWIVYNDIHTHKLMLYPMTEEQAVEVSRHLDFIAAEETHIDDLLAFLCM